MAIRPIRADGGTPVSFDRGKYPPEAFIVPGQDTNGNSIRIYCRVVPMLDRAMDILFGSRKFPFRSKGDMMRWCIKHGVERLEEMEPSRGSVMAQVEAMMTILRDEQLNHSFLTVFQTMTTTIGMHVQAGADGEARRVVAMMKGQILKMENGYWRDRYLRELDEKFGRLMAGHKTDMNDFVDTVDHGHVDEESD